MPVTLAGWSRGCRVWGNTGSARYGEPMGFTRAELESFRGATVPDLIGPGVRLLFVGINPGLWTAATQTHFAHPGNRFYPALRLAGIVDRDLDRADGMTDDDRRYLVGRGIGITNLVERATVRADELTAAELRLGRDRLEALVSRPPSGGGRRGRDHRVPDRLRPAEGPQRRAAGGSGRRSAVDRAESQRAERP